MRIRQTVTENGYKSQSSNLQDKEDIDAVSASEVTQLLNNLSKAERVELIEYVNNDNSLLSPLFWEFFLSSLSFF